MKLQMNMPNIYANWNGLSFKIEGPEDFSNDLSYYIVHQYQPIKEYERGMPLQKEIFTLPESPETLPSEEFK